MALREFSTVTGIIVLLPTSVHEALHAWMACNSDRIRRLIFGLKLNPLPADLTERIDSSGSKCKLPGSCEQPTMCWEAGCPHACAANWPDGSEVNSRRLHRSPSNAVHKLAFRAVPADQSTLRASPSRKVTLFLSKCSSRGIAYFRVTLARALNWPTLIVWPRSLASLCASESIAVL